MADQLSNKKPCSFAAVNARQTQDGLLFDGSHQQSVPIALLTDSNLSPRDKFAWQLLHLHTRSGKNTTFPHYDELCAWLSSHPAREKASRSTVSQTLMMLRLTRWLSLCQRTRDPETGRVQGNIYILHDEALPLLAVIDTEYPTLLIRCLRHTNRALRAVALDLAQTLHHDSALREFIFPSGAESLFKTRSDTQGTHSGLSQNTQGSHSGQRPDSMGYPTYPPHSVLTDTEITNNKTRTEALRWPECLRLSDSEKSLIRSALLGLPDDLRQSVLDECARRIACGSVLRPIAYLLGTIQKAQQGEFNLFRRYQRRSR
ncbi:hypothetical protein QMI71_001721 [Salmonella enterica]|nr:hypothetical protein [Salmonella enterica]